MAIIGRMEKQPAEVLDYDINFTPYLPSTDHLVSAVNTAITGLVVGSVTLFDNTWVKVWLSAGVSGQTYKVEITATSYQGRTKQVEFFVKVREV